MRTRIVAIVILALLVIAAAAAAIFMILRKRQERYEGLSWKIDYLKKIYPLGTGLSEAQFDNLEAYYTLLLPPAVQEKYACNVFRARVPGPSCQELPCDCPGGVPQVGFSPNPMLKDGWPPCNVRDRPECCASTKAYRKCFEEGLIDWAANDTWDGVFENTLQPAPHMNQLWKPSLWNNYTLAVNKYDPSDWNSFYNALGDPDDSWVEVFHSSFSVVNVTYGVWFYRTVGSGVFVNLGRTVAALNKLHMINKLGMSWLEFAKFVLRPYAGDVLTEKVPVGETGLGGKMDYWLNGQYHTNTDEFLEKNGLPKTPEMLARVFEEAATGSYYDLNRMTNTGMVDHLIIVLAGNRYNSIQFTVQANLYTGFTTELMILGPGELPYTDITQIPKSQLRLLDPNNLPRGEPETELGRPCNFNYPFACLYCEGLPATLVPEMACAKDISSYAPCKKGPPPPYGGTAMAARPGGRPNFIPRN